MYNLRGKKGDQNHFESSFVDRKFVHITTKFQIKYFYSLLWSSSSSSQSSISLLTFSAAEKPFHNATGTILTL